MGPVGWSADRLVDGRVDGWMGGGRTDCLRGWLMHALIHGLIACSDARMDRLVGCLFLHPWSDRMDCLAACLGRAVVTPPTPPPPVPPPLQVCVFTAPLFSAFCAAATYGLVKEVRGVLFGGSGSRLACGGR